MLRMKSNEPVFTILFHSMDGNILVVLTRTATEDTINSLSNVLYVVPRVVLIVDYTQSSETILKFKNIYIEISMRCLSICILLLSTRGVVVKWLERLDFGQYVSGRP